MAWLSGLAGKAETILNKLDQNTAAVLSKEKQEIEPQPLLTEVTWVPSSNSLNQNAHSTSMSGTPRHKTFPQIRSSPNLASVTPTISKEENMEDLITYLNTPTETPKKSSNVEPASSPAVPPLIPSATLVDNIDSLSELSVRSERSSPGLSHTSVDVPAIDIIEPFVNDETGLDLKQENLLLKNEVQSLNNELHLILLRAKSSDNECNKLKHQLVALQKEYEYELKNRKTEMDRLVKSSKDADLQNHLKTARRNLEEKDELLGKQQTDHQKEINVLKEKLASIETERTEFSRQMSEIQINLERSRLELNATRSELEQHRARALKTLQEKEKLIAELRSNATTGLDDATLMELNQLRQERELLREENQQICEQLRLTREELISADSKLEKSRQEITQASLQAQEAIAVERRRRLDAEEDTRHHSEEMRTLKEELTLQHDSLSKKLQKQEAEISRLRSQLSAASTPSSEVESRLATLTQTLVQKQQALEHLTTERNALRLQLEKIEHEHRDTIGNLRKNLSYNNVNDTDDAKAQVPTFLIETPFDTGVARRVKRAYSSLDAVSVRTGVFLRRYPLARILVLLYMALLHFWVLVVLFSHSPDAQ